MTLIVRPEAEAEMVEAFDWYEARLPGLGSEFLLNVDATMNAILRNPLMYPVVYKNLRKALRRVAKNNHPSPAGHGSMSTNHLPSPANRLMP